MNWLSGSSLDEWYACGVLNGNTYKIRYLGIDQYEALVYNDGNITGVKKKTKKEALDWCERYEKESKQTMVLDWNERVLTVTRLQAKSKDGVFEYCVTDTLHGWNAVILKDKRFHTSFSGTKDECIKYCEDCEWSLQNDT